MLQFLTQADAAQTANEAATTVQDPEFWTNAMNYIQDSGPGLALKVIGAIVILIVGRFIAGMVRNGMQKVMTARGIDSSLTGFLASLVYFIIMAFTFIAVVGQFGVQTASFVAILGAAGFAVGMAMQGTLGNFASGVMLLLFRPFKAGDFVEAAGVMGSVKEISVFSTIIATPDNKKIIVPNGAIFGGTITNFNGYDTRRVDMVMGIGYGSDMDKAIEILTRLAKEDDRVLDDPAVTIAVNQLADSSVNIIFRPWVKASDYWGVHNDMQKKTKEAFDAAGIEIPFPQTVVHLEKTE